MKLFPFFEGLSKNVKNCQKPSESTVILVFWEVSSSSKTHQKITKNVKNPYIKQFFLIFEGLSKTVTNRQKPLKSTVILVFWGVSSSSKKR